MLPSPTVGYARGFEPMKNGEIFVIINTINNSKYFALSDWLQSPELFFITIWRLQDLEDADSMGCQRPSNLPLFGFP